MQHLSLSLPLSLPLFLALTLSLPLCLITYCTISFMLTWNHFNVMLQSLFVYFFKDRANFCRINTCFWFEYHLSLNSRLWVSDNNPGFGFLTKHFSPSPKVCKARDIFSQPVKENIIHQSYNVTLKIKCGDTVFRASNKQTVL